jgi:hypothetical protein
MFNYAFCYRHVLSFSTVLRSGLVGTRQSPQPSLVTLFSGQYINHTQTLGSHNSSDCFTSHSSSDCIIAAAVTPASPPNLILSAASIRCICDVLTHVGAHSPRSRCARCCNSRVLQAAQGSSFDTLSVTWSDGLNWEVAGCETEANTWAMMWCEANAVGWIMWM